jgi:xanthine dehydrogenase accessory factor
MTHAELVTLLQAAREARLARPTVPLALATLVAVEGSSYRQPGAYLLCDAEERVLAGAISGGCLEQDVAARAPEVCATGRAVLHAYDLREDLETIWGFGSGCDGVAHVLLAPLATFDALEAAVAAGIERTPGALWHALADNASTSLGDVRFVRAHEPSPGDLGSEWFVAPMHPPVHLIIVGATRGAEAMARIAHVTGWRITVVDHRDAVLGALSLPHAAPGPVTRAVVHPDHAATWLTTHAPAVDSRTAIALCTHRFEHDLAWLHAALHTPAPYVGVLGSRQRAARLIATLDENAPTARARVYAPLGLDLGGDSPDEVALSAVSEVQAVLHHRPGGSLRHRQTPLHTRTETPQLHSEPVIASCTINAAKPS